jgi:hypothetical protein
MQNVQKRPVKSGDLAKITGTEQGPRTEQEIPAPYMTIITASEVDVIIASEPSFQVGARYGSGERNTKSPVRFPPGLLTGLFRLRFLARVTFHVKRNFWIV